MMKKYWIFFKIIPCILCSSLAVANDYSRCSVIDNPEKRLKCYDDEVQKYQIINKYSDDIDSQLPMKQRIDNEKKLSNVGGFIIVPHRPTYIMPFTYAAGMHTEPFKDIYADETGQLQNFEAKFQISFKVPLWMNIADKDINLWFGYTQLSLWQLYNSQVSSPFRETNYQPEIALAFTSDFKLLGMNNTFVVVGLDHQSNGQSKNLSRSWNRLYTNFVLEHKNMMIYFKPWYRLPESAENDDNPDIDEYLGYSELSLFYKNRDSISGIRLWNNLRAPNNRTSVQLDWSFPVAPSLKVYIQYFNGYGETLLDYNYRTKRIGLGIMLTDWF